MLKYRTCICRPELSQKQWFQPFKRDVHVPTELGEWGWSLCYWRPALGHPVALEDCSQKSECACVCVGGVVKGGATLKPRGNFQQTAAKGLTVLEDGLPWALVGCWAPQKVFGRVHIFIHWEHLQAAINQKLRGNGKSYVRTQERTYTGLGLTFTESWSRAKPWATRFQQPCRAWGMSPHEPMRRHSQH